MGNRWPVTLIHPGKETFRSKELTAMECLGDVTEGHGEVKTAQHLQPRGALSSTKLCYDRPAEAETAASKATLNSRASFFDLKCNARKCEGARVIGTSRVTTVPCTSSLKGCFFFFLTSCGLTSWFVAVHLFLFNQPLQSRKLGISAPRRSVVS